MIWAVIAQLSEVVEEEESEAEPVILLFASPQSDTLPPSGSRPRGSLTDYHHHPMFCRVTTHLPPLASNPRGRINCVIST